VSLIGCGPSKEKQQMSNFITEYSQAVDKFAELSKQADKSGIAEEKAKIESFKSRWSDMKVDMASEITPQVLNKLDNEFNTITKKFQAIAASA
jgi:hypothetical protein